MMTGTSHQGREAKGSFVQFGSSQANASQILENCDFRIDVVENDFGSVEIEADCVVKLGSQRLQRV